MGSRPIDLRLARGAEAVFHWKRLQKAAARVGKCA